MASTPDILDISPKSRRQHPRGSEYRRGLQVGFVTCFLALAVGWMIEPVIERVLVGQSKHKAANPTPIEMTIGKDDTLLDPLPLRFLGNKLIDGQYSPQPDASFSCVLEPPADLPTQHFKIIGSKIVPAQTQLDISQPKVNATEHTTTYLSCTSTAGNFYTYRIQPGIPFDFKM
ncbi:MAG TPA: hypothetical protein VLG37_02830 [Candidatus Saccharimonadales bacterium]|nr:hypothetical protein [Candidatus Saccharimonadales bacterium]